MFKWNIQTDIGAIKPFQVEKLYKSAGCKLPRMYAQSPRFLEAMFGPGCYGFFVFNDCNDLIGIARVLSDDLMSSWVAELIVAPDWQDKGVGTALINSLKQRFHHTNLHLEAFLGQQGFFERNGIKPRDVLVSCARSAHSVDEVAQQAC